MLDTRKLVVSKSKSHWIASSQFFFLSFFFQLNCLFIKINGFLIDVCIWLQILTFFMKKKNLSIKLCIKLYMPSSQRDVISRLKGWVEWFHVDTADTLAVLDGDSDVSSFTPVRAPGVSDNVVWGLTFSVVTNSNDGVVKAGSA